jgi:hypothetical protein
MQRPSRSLRETEAAHPDVAPVLRIEVSGPTLQLLGQSEHTPDEVSAGWRERKPSDHQHAGSPVSLADQTTLVNRNRPS